MTIQIKPLKPKVIANTASNKSTVHSANAVYILGTAADTITNEQTGATFQIGANVPVVMFKKTVENIYSGANTTHMTKIEMPRG